MPLRLYGKHARSEDMVVRIYIYIYRCFYDWQGYTSKVMVVFKACYTKMYARFPFVSADGYGSPKVTVVCPFVIVFTVSLLHSTLL